VDSPYAYPVGNAAILPPPPLEPDAQPPLPGRVLWTVYKLREEGKKLPVSSVVCRAKKGLLQVLVGGPKFQASLVDVAGYPPLANLYDASLVKMNTSGLLLTGIEIGNGRHGPMEWRQTWWCTVLEVEQG
jgi:hypothetical protein